MGGCTTRILLAVCRRRVGRSCSAIPPIGGDEVAVWSVVAAKVQTHWVKGTQKRRFWLNGSALWRIHCLACWSHANPLAGVGTRYVARNSPATTSTCEIASLELQRFLGISKSDRIKLRATFVGVERRRWGANGGAPTAGKLGTAAGRDPEGSRPVSRAARLTRGRSYCPRHRWLLPALSVSLAHSCAVVGEAASRTPSATASEIVGETTLAPTRAVNIC